MKNKTSFIPKFKIGICTSFIMLILLFENPSPILAQQHGDLVRIQGEEKIYLIQSGQRRAIATEEVFNRMGFKMEDVKELDAQTVMNIPEGPPLWSKETIAPHPEGALIRLKGKAQAYVIRGGRKCYIPDPETFQANGFQWDQVIEVDQSTFNKIPTGIPIASVKPPYQYGQPGMPPQVYPGSPASPYPPQSYPPSAYPPQTYPPQTYPPSTTPSPQPYPYPPAYGPSVPSYPPTAPPSYPTSPSYPPPPSPPAESPSPSPSSPPPSSSLIPSAPFLFNEKSLVNQLGFAIYKTGGDRGILISRYGKRNWSLKG